MKRVLDILAMIVCALFALSIVSGFVIAYGPLLGPGFLLASALITSSIYRLCNK